MAIPYIQLDTDFVRTKAVRIAAKLKVHRHRIVGMASDLFAFIIEETSTDEKPPDGILVDPDATTILEQAMYWDGEPGAAVSAFMAAGVIEKLEVGARVLGTDRYVRTWEKNNRRKTGTKPAPLVPVTGTKPATKVPQEEEEEGEEDEKKDPPPTSSVAPFELKPTPADPQPRARSEAQQFWDHFQKERTELHGFVKEREPEAKRLNKWLKDTLPEVGTVERLWDGAALYLARPQDNFWADKRFPFAGYAGSAWRQYVPSVQAVAS